MATVTIDAERLTRLRSWAGYGADIIGRNAVGVRLQPGDLDPSTPDPEPSVDERDEALSAFRAFVRADDARNAFSDPELWPEDDYEFSAMVDSLADDKKRARAAVEPYMGASE